MVCWDWHLIIGAGVGMGCKGCDVVVVVHTIHTCTDGSIRRGTSNGCGARMKEEAEGRQIEGRRGI
jgi:hypothetical protein